MITGSNFNTFKIFISYQFCYKNDIKNEVYNKTSTENITFEKFEKCDVFRLWLFMIHARTRVKRLAYYFFFPMISKSIILKEKKSEFILTLSLINLRLYYSEEMPNIFKSYIILKSVKFCVCILTFFSKTFSFLKVSINSF